MQLWMADGEGKQLRLIFAGDGRQIRGGCVSPDGNYVLFTGNKDEGEPTNAGEPMGLLSLRDPPKVTYASFAARKEHPGTRAEFPLSPRWKPHWTSANLERAK